MCDLSKPCLFLHTPSTWSNRLLWSRNHRVPLLAKNSCWHHSVPPMPQQHHHYQQDLQLIWCVGECEPLSLYYFLLHQYCECQCGIWHRLSMSSTFFIHAQWQDNITLGNYEEVLTNLSEAVTGAAINEEQQTTSNLAIVAAAFSRSAALINEMTIIPNTVSFAG